MKDFHEERVVLLSQRSYLRCQIDDAFSALGVTPIALAEAFAAGLQTLIAGV